MRFFELIKAIYFLQLDRRKVFRALARAGIEHPRHGVLIRDQNGKVGELHTFALLLDIRSEEGWATMAITFVHFKSYRVIFVYMCQSVAFIVSKSVNRVTVVL